MKLHHSLAFFSAVAMAVPLTACQDAETPAPQETQEATANPDAKPGISGSGGRLVLPVVAGRPAAVYFTLRNDGPDAAALVGVHITGVGEAQMHKTDGGTMSSVTELDIAPGASLEFAPGGLHVMAFDLDDSLKTGGNAELTLTFSDGDKLSMPLHVEPMGGGAEGEGMGDHQNMPEMPH